MSGTALSAPSRLGPSYHYGRSRSQVIRGAAYGLEGAIVRPETKGQAGACPDRTRVIPCKVQAVTGQIPEAGKSLTAFSRLTGRYGTLAIMPDIQ